VTSKRGPSLLQIGLAALLLAAVYLVWTRASGAPSDSPPPSSMTRPAPGGPTAAAPRSTTVATPLAEAFRAQRSGVEIDAGGRVTRVLSDDREGSRHERFLVRIEGVSVLVAHNLDLAPRVPVAAGDSIELRGEYEWNPKGGVIHWTHRDPDGRHAAGWIRHDGRLYQ
jgi:hypothetical protein